ncbi:hypothetical protein GGR50DRAFT_699660 [Xylaria sp. CBS 124048]|nr:hypothetical protein GGR50DRAFT_699660 [Xylaria sp. CBS 124048]
MSSSFSSASGQRNAVGGSGGGSVPGVPRRRACDECRIRKLACTKEPDGCFRCRREMVVCHYSPQKPMGRPRKRLWGEVDDSGTGTTGKTAVNMGMNMDFIDFSFGGRGFDGDQTVTAQTGTSGTTTSGTENEIAMVTDGQNWINNADWGAVDFDFQARRNSLLGPTDIDPGLFPSRPAGISPGDQLASDSPFNSNPSVSNPSHSDSTESSTTPTAGSFNTTTPSCHCTANLYAALHSMQTLPSEVESAVRQARLAAKTAYEVVNCSHCSFRLDLPIYSHAHSHSHSPSHSHSYSHSRQNHVQHDSQHTASIMRGFQTLMLLSTLIPSIVHAYATMLAIVDEETNKAIAERRNIVVQLDGLGGIRGCRLADEYETEHQNTDGRENERGKERSKGTDKYREMEPSLWRLTVRALMKFDVYGLSGSATHNPSSPYSPHHQDHNGNMSRSIGDPFHLGLKDLVLLMEKKSKERHAVMEAMVNAGVWQIPANCPLPPGGGGSKSAELPTCQRVISIARSSVEQLVIP